MKVFQRETQLRTAGGLPRPRHHRRGAGGGSRERRPGRDRLRLLAAHDLLRARQRARAAASSRTSRSCCAGSCRATSYYAHDDWDRRTENICPEDMDIGNGHSHCMAMLLGTAGESIPIRDGELLLGTWQRVLFLELDRERDRRWIVQVVGS